MEFFEINLEEAIYRRHYGEISTEQKMDLL